MKKRVLFCVSFFVMSTVAYSQSLSLTNFGGAISNGDTIVAWGDTSSTINAYVYVKNNSGSAEDVHVRKKYLSVVPGSFNSFCWGMCYLEGDFVSTTFVTINAGATVYDFIGDYKANGNIGVSYIRYTFFNKANANDSVCVVVAYDAAMNAIDNGLNENVGFFNAYPNPASDQLTLTYDIPSVSMAGCNIMIRDLSGKVIYDSPLTGNAGTINFNTGNFGDGLYFYSVYSGNRSLIAKRVVISH
jgi:hypothetical protein